MLKWIIDKIIRHKTNNRRLSWIDFIVLFIILTMSSNLQRTFFFFAINLWYVYNVHECFSVHFRLITSLSVLNSFADKTWLLPRNSGQIFLFGLDPGEYKACIRPLWLLDCYWIERWITCSDLQTQNREKCFFSNYETRKPFSINRFYDIKDRYKIRNRIVWWSLQKKQST